MKQTGHKPQTTPFSLSKFIKSTLGYLIIFTAILGIFYLISPQMLEYKFLFISSVIVALILGFYHAKYKNQSDVDLAVDADIHHIEEEIEEEIEEVSNKLHTHDK